MVNGERWKVDREGDLTRFTIHNSHITKKSFTIELETRKLSKSVRGMPRLSEARKDVTSCDKPR